MYFFLEIYSIDISQLSNVYATPCFSKKTQAFLKGFAKIACDIKLYGTVRNLIIYFAETFRSLLTITLL